MKNVFDKQVSDELIARILQLTPDTQPVWGKMNVSQMLAHCNVPYEMVFASDSASKFKKAKGLKALMLRTFIKPIVVGTKPYRKNGPTAPEFKIVDEREFNAEKTKLLENIARAYESGPEFFDQRESPSFGALTSGEWSNLYYKHLDHHLNQFGV